MVANGDLFVWTICIENMTEVKATELLRRQGGTHGFVRSVAVSVSVSLSVSVSVSLSVSVSVSLSVSVSVSVWLHICIVSVWLHICIYVYIIYI